MSFFTTRFPVFFLLLSLNLITPLQSQAGTHELGEQIQFSYSTTDGGFQLECKHWMENIGSGDFTVICGKGTATVKEYSAHVVIRELPAQAVTRFEILYWVTDRNVSRIEPTKPMPGFSSHSQILTLDQKARIRDFTISQGLENDSAELSLHYQP